MLINIGSVSCYHLILLLELFLLDSLTPFGNSLLIGKTDLTHLPLTSLQKLYLSELRKSSSALSSPLHHHISLSDMSQGLKKWKESTSTSPSNRHLGHCKSFLVSDRKENDDDILPLITKCYKLSTPSSMLQPNHVSL